MRTFNFKPIRWGGVLLVAVFLIATIQTQTPPTSAQTPPRVGIVCTTAASPNPTFTLTTQTGYILLPDSNTMFMWGYSQAGHPFQHPGPVLCVNEGDLVTVILQNTLSEPVSIMFPGQEDVMANGVPAQPQFVDNGSGPQLTSLTNAAAPGSSITYSFVATNPGTYIYESGTNPRKQVGMGLFGALIVRPALGANYVYNRADSQFTPTEEFMVLLSEIDPYLNQAVERGRNYN